MTSRENGRSFLRIGAGASKAFPSGEGRFDYKEIEDG